MLHEVFLNPSAPYKNLGTDGYTVQIHSELPEQVKIGHYVMTSLDPVIEEVVSRSEYLDRIQQACAEHGDAITVRFYDHIDGFDASVLDQLDQVRSLVIQSYGGVTNPEAVGRLPNLTALSYAPYGKVPRNMLSLFRVERLTRLTLSETGKPPLDLSPIGEAQSLLTLRLLSRGDNTEAIGNCAALTELAMHPTEKIDLGFVSRLPRLEVLKFALGKIKTIAAIESAPKLRDLSFNLVSMLEDLGELQRFPTLRRLQLEQQKKLKKLRVGPGNVALEHIRAEALEEIAGFSELPALKSLYNFNGKVEVDWSKQPATLTHLAQWPTGLKAREKYKAEVSAHGLIPEPHPDAYFFYK